MDFNGSQYLDVKSQRKINTDYTNGTTKALLVVVGYHMPYNNPITTFTVNKVKVAAANSDGGHTRGTFTLMIPPNGTYKLTKNSGAAPIESWHEMYSQDDLVGFELLDVTKQRAWDTVYVNDTGDGIWLSISIITKTAEFAVLLVDGVPVAKSSSNTSHTNNHAIMTLIPAGASYILSKPKGTISFNVWSELRKV